MYRFKLAIILLLVSWKEVYSSVYRPVVLIHGLFGNSDTWPMMVKMLSQEFEGINITQSLKFEGLLSVVNDMWTQVEGTYNELKHALTVEGDGITLICYSQGGLTCRGLLERYSDVNVHTFISLSAPLAGEYGLPKLITENLTLWKNLRLQDVYKIAYTPAAQRNISIANYWNDPFHQDLFRRKSMFLPKLNNCSGCYDNFVKIKRMVLVGGEDDEVIIPWQSSQFKFYAENSDKTVSEIQDTEIYQKDSFGLKTLYSMDRVTTCTMSNINHFEWPDSRTVFDKCIKNWIK